MASAPSKEQASAREEVMKCEQEIQSIKAALRRLGTAGNADEPNSMEIIFLKVEGLPESITPVLNLQLSSPIEEGTLSEIFDPLNKDPALEGSSVTFKGVETSMATLTVTAKDVDIPLGASSPHDVAPLCSLDPMNIKDQYVSELPMAILSENAEKLVATEAAEDSKEGASEATTEAALILPTCTVTLKITYRPSPKDQREELYELLNKTSQRKATALENLRKFSMTMTRAGGDPAGRGSTTTVAKPSVKPGFLNKKQKEPTGMEKLYERTIGPNSMLRRGFGVVIVARNYVIFLGAVTFFHFQGQLLALPPPV